MSVIKFELKQDHLKLLKHLSWKELTEGKEIITSGTNSPFGGLDYYEDMGVILFGQPEDFDPFEGDPFIWTDIQRGYMDKLIKELPLAIEVILSTGSFELGNYKSRYHIREWKRMEKKGIVGLLWLDDQRDPYQGSWLYDYAPEYETNGAVHWVKSCDEFVRWITENGMPDMIAFDHDLGVKDGEISKSGYDAAKWLIDYCLDNKLGMCKWVVQSSNPAGADNINGLLMNYVKYFEKN